MTARGAAMLEVPTFPSFEGPKIGCKGFGPPNPGPATSRFRISKKKRRAKVLCRPNKERFHKLTMPATGVQFLMQKESAVQLQSQTMSPQPRDILTML